MYLPCPLELQRLTSLIAQYEKFKPQLVAKIEDYMENYNDYKIPMNSQLYNLKRSFFSGEALYKAISNG